MLKAVGLGCALAFVLAAPALADPSECSDPIAPANVDGAAATEAQMKSFHDDVVNFLRASDDYQACLFGDLTSQRQAAEKAKKDLDQSVVDDINARVDANQKLKQKVGGEFNAAANAYNAKHPGQ